MENNFSVLLSIFQLHALQIQYEKFTNSTHVSIKTVKNKTGNTRITEHRGALV